jgi:NAD(P)H-flavin reductase
MTWLWPRHAEAFKGLKDTLQTQGYFLACVCKPTEDLHVVEAGDAGKPVAATVASVTALNDTTVELRLRTKESFEYFPGQFANLERPGGLIRSYSIASVPALDADLQFQIALLPGGRMSGWVHDEAKPGDEVHLRGPLGDCFYAPGNSDQALFLLGTGTGLAPLYAIARDALHQNHAGPVHLFHGSLQREGLYLVDALRAMAADHANFHYHPCALEDSTGGNDVHVGAIDAHALETFPDLKGWRVFLCGHPDLVKLMQRKAFLAGAGLNDIFADAFLPSQD